MEERDPEKYLEIVQDTLCFKGITFLDVYNHLYNGSPSIIETISFDSNILEMLDRYFSLFGIGNQRLLKNKRRIAVKKEIVNEINILCANNELEEFKSHLLLIIYFTHGITLNNKGKKSVEREGLTNLNILLNKTYKKIYNINIDGNEVVIEQDLEKYSIKAIEINLVDEIGNTEKLTIENEIILSNFLPEAFVKIFNDFKISEELPQKRSTNQLFTQNFFHFIDTETPFSTSNSKSEQNILDLFIEIYLLSGNEFFKDAKSANFHKWCQGTVRKWFKPQRK